MLTINKRSNPLPAGVSDSNIILYILFLRELLIIVLQNCIHALFPKWKVSTLRKRNRDEQNSRFLLAF